jgi:hypothetical protein
MLLEDHVHVVKLEDIITERLIHRHKVVILVAHTTSYNIW